MTGDLQGIEFSFVGAAGRGLSCTPFPCPTMDLLPTIPAVPSSPFPSKSSHCILCPSPKCIDDTFVSRNRKSGEHSLILAHTEISSFSDSLFHILGKLRAAQTGMALSAGWREAKLIEMCGKVSRSVCVTQKQFCCGWGRGEGAPIVFIRILCGCKFITQKACTSLRRLICPHTYFLLPASLTKQTCVLPAVSADNGVVYLKFYAG